MSDIPLTVANPITKLSLSAHARPAVRLATIEPELDHLTILAHDLRNYLTPVYGQLSMVHSRAQREERELDIQAAARGKQALDHALSLITNLLDATRAERGLFELNMQPLNLSLAVQQAAEVFQADTTPLLLCVRESITVRADRERLRQVLHNLLANAITHSPRGMPVSLELTTEWHECTIWAVLRIHNGGPGIAPELLDRLFQRFTAGPGSSGLGLGLYLARGIAEAHGGTLTAHSSEGAGACFTLALPLLDDCLESV